MNNLACAIIILATIVFMIGFHNLDLAWNMDSGCLDTALFGEVRNRNEIYQMALKQMFSGFFLSVLAIFLPDIRVNKSLNFRCAK